MVVSRMLESSMPSPTSPARMRRPTMNHTEGSWFERKYRSNSKGHPLVIGCIPRKCKKKKRKSLHPSCIHQEQGQGAWIHPELEKMRGVIAPTKNILHLPCALHGTCTIISFILFHILLISRDTWKLVCLEISEEAAKRPDSPEWKWQAGCRRMDGVPPAGKLAKTEPQCWAKTTIDWYFSYTR